MREVDVMYQDWMKDYEKIVNENKDKEKTV